MRLVEPNIITLTDGYKPTHWMFYPKNLQYLVSYMESRGGMFAETVYYGAQFILKEYLVGQVVTQEKIDKAEAFYAEYYGDNTVFNKAGWQYILDEHDGYLPLEIKSVPEGTPVPVSNIMALITNTDEGNVPWLTNHIETIFLQAWYPITVATLSREIKKVLIKYLMKTTDYTMEEINNLVAFMLHDFGFRGTETVDSAGIGGSAHLVNFLGTDTIAAIEYAQAYYNTSNMLGFSIRATEHSTMTTWNDELKAMKNVLDMTPSGAFVACVSDSYDIMDAIKNKWGKALKDQIMSREGRLIVRPDSGHPETTLKNIFHALWDAFGEYGTVNEKGFKVLPHQIRVIQGDGVEYDSIIRILDMMVEEGFSVENIAFGMGGALLQKLDRDTQKFAIKACEVQIDGERMPVSKNPKEFNEKGEYVTSFKKSKGGNMKLVKAKTGFITVTSEDPDFEMLSDSMVTVFRNGELIKEFKFQDVRNNAAINFSEIADELEEVLI